MMFYLTALLFMIIASVDPSLVFLRLVIFIIVMANLFMDLTRFSQGVKILSK